MQKSVTKMIGGLVHFTYEERQYQQISKSYSDFGTASKFFWGCQPGEVSQQCCSYCSTVGTQGLFTLPGKVSYAGLWGGLGGSLPLNAWCKGAAMGSDILLYWMLPETLSHCKEDAGSWTRCVLAWPSRVLMFLWTNWLHAVYQDLKQSGNPGWNIKRSPCS